MYYKATGLNYRKAVSRTETVVKGKKKRLYQRSTDDHVVLDSAAQMCLVEKQTCRKFETANGDGKEDKGNLLRLTTVNKGAFVY